MATAPKGRLDKDFMPAIVSSRPGRPTLQKLGRTRPFLQGLGRVLAVAGLLASACALTACAWLDQRQRQIALRPSPTLPAHVAAAAPSWQPGDTRELITLPGGEVLALWWLPHADPQAPTLLYLHGTFRNLYQNMPKIVSLRQAGYAVVAVDYRGWGDSTAMVPSEASIHADAQRAWAELQRRQPDPLRRVVFGHSMGGAVAVALASGLKHGSDYAALVLESTFTRMPDVASEAGFWGRVAGAATTLQFDSLSRIGRVDAPILMLHGTADTTVPVQLGRRLRDAAPAGVRWIEVPEGTHSRLNTEAPDLYQQALRDLLKPGKRIPAAPARTQSP
jgi:pimeloyl-ACP methyl ester carboxylesterase